MNKKRVLFALLSAALLTLVIAAPVIAVTVSKPGESGYVRMYTYVNTDDDCTWEAAGTSVVRLAFDATVDPYSIAMNVTGTKLKPRTEYALVNVTDFRNHPGGPYWVDVRILGTAVTNKPGALSLKACTDEPLSDSWNDESGVWARFAGADVWLLPRGMVLDYSTPPSACPPIGRTCSSLTSFLRSGTKSLLQHLAPLTGRANATEGGGAGAPPPSLCPTSSR